MKRIFKKKKIRKKRRKKCCINSLKWCCDLWLLHIQSHIGASYTKEKQFRTTIHFASIACYFKRLLTSNISTSTSHFKVKIYKHFLLLLFSWVFLLFFFSKKAILIRIICCKNGMKARTKNKTLYIKCWYVYSFFILSSDFRFDSVFFLAFCFVFLIRFCLIVSRTHF